MAPSPGAEIAGRTQDPFKGVGRTAVQVPDVHLKVRPGGGAQNRLDAPYQTNKNQYAIGVGLATDTKIATVCCERSIEP